MEFLLIKVFLFLIPRTRKRNDLLMALCPCETYKMSVKWKIVFWSQKVDF